MNIKILKKSFFLFLCMALIGCQEKDSYTTTGYVEGNFIYLSSPQGGYLQELLVANGQKVKKGQLLLKLNPQSQQSRADIKNIYADFAGEIKDIFYQQSEYVLPQSPILSLFVPSKMRIVFYVSETHLNKIKSGKDISIILEDKTYTSKISYLSSEAEYTPEAIFSERNRYKLVYKVKAVLPLDLKDVLKPGQPVEINYE